MSRVRGLLRGVTIALVMIVRNEAETLPRLIASVRDHVDTYTIVDTGSSPVGSWVSLTVSFKAEG